MHRVADLSRSLPAALPGEIEARVSQVLAALQAEAGAEIMACRFRPQPNCLISLRLRENPLGPAGTKAVAQTGRQGLKATTKVAEKGVNAVSQAGRQSVKAVTQAGRSGSKSVTQTYNTKVKEAM